MNARLFKTIPTNLIVCFSCSKIKEKENYIIRKVKNEASITSTIVWKKGVEKMGFKVKNEQGKRVEFLGGFYQCFIIYDADKESVLEYLNNLKTSHPEISDVSYTITDQQIIEEKYLD
jgi:hypothetical protein